MLMKIINICREIWKGPHRRACHKNSDVMARSCEEKDPFAPISTKQTTLPFICAQKGRLSHIQEVGEAGHPSPHPLTGKPPAPSGPWQSKKFNPSPQHTRPSTNPALMNPALSQAGPLSECKTELSLQSACQVKRSAHGGIFLQ